MSWTCPQCETRIRPDASECPECGMPTTFMDPDDGLVRTGAEPAVEPEVLESLDEAERTRFAGVPQPRHLGCSLGPGCGCIGLPLAALAGLLVSALMAALWVLSLGRVPFSIATLARQARRRPGRG